MTASKRKAAKAKTEKANNKRDPHDSEKQAIERARETRQNRPARVTLDQLPDANEKVLRLAAPHNDEDGFGVMLCEGLGTRSGAFVDEALLHLAKLTGVDGKVSMNGINSSLAIIGAIDPQNELETALAVQIAGTHQLSISMLERAKGAKYIEHVRDYGNLATKLQRTMATMVKTLSDHRRGGEQVVRHLHVYEGGQAVVAGTINQGPTQREVVAQPYGLSPALLGENAAGYAVPVPSDPGTQPVPVARMRDQSGDRPDLGGTEGQHECHEARRVQQGAPGDDEGAEAA